MATWLDEMMGSPTAVALLAEQRKQLVDFVV